MELRPKRSEEDSTQAGTEINPAAVLVKLQNDEDGSTQCGNQQVPNASQQPAASQADEPVDPNSSAPATAAETAAAACIMPVLKPLPANPCDQGTNAGAHEVPATQRDTNVPSFTPLLEFCHMDDRHLFENAKAYVQQHFSHSSAAGPSGSFVPEPETYPVAQVTHADVIADASLFHRTLRELYDTLKIKVAKVMKLGGQELNLHLLYQRVTDAGGALQVIKDKHWRDVGDAFHLPKTITSVSFVLKRGYMMYLWDYEQLYFHGNSGNPRVPVPVSRYTKDHGAYSSARSAQPPCTLIAPQLPAGQVAASTAVDAAAAMAVAALRGRQDWAAAPQAQGGHSQPEDGTQHAHHLPEACGDPTSLANTSRRSESNLSHEAPRYPNDEHQSAVPSQQMFDSSPACPRVPLAAIPIAPSHTLAPLAVNQNGEVWVAASLGGHGYLLEGHISGLHFRGVLGDAGCSSGTNGRNPQCSQASEPALKRPRASSWAHADSSHNMPTLDLPLTCVSLIEKVGLCPQHATESMDSHEAASAAWAALDAHKRSVVEHAIHADEERFRAEQASRHAHIALQAAQQRCLEAMHAAEHTLCQGGMGVSSHSGPPSSVSLHLPASMGFHPVMPAKAQAPFPPLASSAPAVCEDPLMTHVAHPAHTHRFAASLPPSDTVRGPSSFRHDIHGELRGPVASPNVNTRPLDPSRHNIYANAHDTPVNPLPGHLPLPQSCDDWATSTGLDDTSLHMGDFKKSDEIDLGLDGHDVNELFNDAAIWAFQDDLMLEEPP